MARGQKRSKKRTARPLSPVKRPAEREVGGYRPAWSDQRRMAICYPGSYGLGMANLGFQAVYRLVNEQEGWLCERAFLPDRPGEAVVTLESGRELGEFDLVAFSISFEEDLLHVLEILQRSRIPLRAADRDRGPLVMAGGPVCFLNPEPLAPFMDLMAVGEAEALLPAFLAAESDCAEASREEAVRILAGQPGIYAPSLYEVTYDDQAGWVAERRGGPGCAERIRRRWVPSLATFPTSDVVYGPREEFADMALTEVSRGCLWGCRFCAAGYIYRPYRERPAELVLEEARQGLEHRPRVGLVGADLSDHSEFAAICAGVLAMGGSYSPASLRVDAFDGELAASLAQAGHQTVTLAPEAGSQRLRAVVNKDLTDERIVTAARICFAAGIPNLKMYFLVGLPTETDDDVLAIADLVAACQATMVEEARARGWIGQITVGVNPFIPKPFTPFQWSAMADQSTLRRRAGLLERALGRIANVSFHLEPLRSALWQAILSRGDRRLAPILEEVLATGGDYRPVLRAHPELVERYACREAPVEAVLPWEFIDHEVGRDYLLRERRRALDNRLTPPCRPASCRACGLACGERSVERSV